MKLSTAASLGIQGVLVLAGAGTITLDEICRAGELPRDYMARIFSLLTRAGLVVAVRGKNGGYRLGRDPESISLLEVIEAIDGRLALNLCQHDPPQCEQVGRSAPMRADGLPRQARLEPDPAEGVRRPGKQEHP